MSDRNDSPLEGEKPESPPPIPPEPPAGPGVGVGAGCGCLAMVLAVLLLLSFASSGITLGGSVALILEFGLIPVAVAIALLFRPKTRRMGIGMLIVSASVWIVFLGPCIAILWPSRYS